MVILLLIVIHISYFYYISPSFTYMGYSFNFDYDILDIFTMVIFCIAPLYIIRTSKSRFSDFVIFTIYIIVYIPTQYLLTFLDLSVATPLLLRVAFFTGIIIPTAASKIKVYFFPVLSISIEVFHLFLAIIFIILLLLVMSQFGFQLQFVNFDDVYDVRGEYKEGIASSGAGFAYAVSYLSALSAFMIAYGTIFRYPIFSLLGSLALFYIFGFTGLKGILFSTLMVIAILFLYKTKSQKIANAMLLSTTVLIAITIIVDNLFNNHYLTGLIVRRVFLTPGLLSIYYFDFFTSNQPVMLSHSFLKLFISYPYDINPPYLIGKFYFNSPNMSANANMFADSYANFRFFGIILFSGLLGFILSLIDNYTGNLKNIAVISAGFAIPVLALTNTGLFTTLLSHGFIFMIIITFLYTSSQHTSRPTNDNFSSEKQVT